MRQIVFLMVIAFCSSSAFAQAQKPAAKKEAAKPAVVAENGKKSRRAEDARHCLEKASNTEIIKCAEAYL